MLKFNYKVDEKNKVVICEVLPYNPEREICGPHDIPRDAFDWMCGPAMKVFKHVGKEEKLWLLAAFTRMFFKPQKFYRGKARCHPNDVFDVEKGKNIARDRALLKYYRDLYMSTKDAQSFSQKIGDAFSKAQINMFNRYEGIVARLENK